MAADPNLKLNIVRSRALKAVSAPAFVESPIGQNTDPKSKNADFLSIVNTGFTGIAMFKYCYIDIGESTDVTLMFREYQATIDAVLRRNPNARIVHVTVPLTTVSYSLKTKLKNLLGRNTAHHDNIKRNRYNAVLRQAFADEPIFDLAKVESTHADGSRSFFVSGGEPVYTLAPEYTDDGGHLNALGRQLAARHLIEVLASV